MSRRGELNVGQLVRERHPGECLSVGFTTYAGTVTAATDWGAEAQRRRVRPALPESCEALLHASGVERFLLADAGAGRTGLALRRPQLERAIGVIYRPETERASHYFTARPADQFDALVHLDVTRAVEPLERTGAWELGEPPETYPTAL
jgi:erythromycin esterase-like protein